MLVSDLQPGMLLVAAGDNECFAIYGGRKERWLRVRIKPKYRRSMDMMSEIYDGPVLYLGTKKELAITQEWTNKFVLVDKEIVGVDPSSWRRMKPST